MMGFDHTEGFPGKELGPQKLLEQIKNIRYVDNPQKLANYQRCIALSEKLENEWSVPVRIEAIPGGATITLRLFWSSYFSSFNALLGELIGRGSEFSPRPDPKDPCYTVLSMSVFYQDRAFSGRLLPG